MNLSKILYKILKFKKSGLIDDMKKMILGKPLLTMILGKPLLTMSDKIKLPYTEATILEIWRVVCNHRE